MDIQVWELIEHLKTFPGEMRLAFQAQTIGGVSALGDTYRLVREADKAVLTIVNVDLQTMPPGV
ncbi:MAG TPA: hypothetical protein VGM62_09610 [Chthoniobacterales bacterium]|jgi:hypothetical protein